MKVTANYDTSVLDKQAKSSKRRVVSVDKDMKMMLNELIGIAAVFEENPRRQYKHCCGL